jgi:imidazolonepropionase
LTAVALAAKRIVTCDPQRATAEDPLGVLEDAALIHDAGTIQWVGPRSAVQGVEIVDYGSRVITAGLVDAHTHSAWMGSRHDEYALRMAGADYRTIAAAGGGILSSHRAIMAATEADIFAELRARLRRMAEMGVTTVEAKSGYGLEPDGERKQLKAIARARGDASLPGVVATFLALHALPASAKEAREQYVHNASGLVAEVAEQGLADFVDAYVDQNAFSVDEARLVCAPAKSAGLGVRLHVGQFADVGGAELCAELGARSADHLEHVGAAGIAALAKANVFATLLPIASVTLRQAPPPVRELREAGVPFVVASDANPGTAPSESLPLALSLAVALYGLTPAEALLGATRHAAASLGLVDTASPRGWIGPGMRADVVVWDLPHETAIVQPWGTSRTHLVLREGLAIAGRVHRAIPE